MNTVICQKWGESEQGWGQSPNGYSLHLTVKERDKYVKCHNKSLPEMTPKVYDYAVGEPYEVKVGDRKYTMLKKSKSLRFDGDAPKPRLGGK